MVAIALLVMVLGADPQPVIVVDRDDVEIDTSCVVRFADRPVADVAGDGVLRITGDDITVRCEGDLRGADAARPPDTLTGVGIRITGRGVTLIGASVRGFKVGILATGAEGLTIDGARVADGFRQHLRSTPRAEAPEDWLWPHENDAHEWRTRYGAAICVEDARSVTIRDATVRGTQNGIVLDTVTESWIYDNDCSFLSGWGLAMWRCRANVVSRNAFDFCVRGYSHGVYNRGQDSAGILLFEQCTDNTIAENSATHGGDGLFGFAGREALGEVEPREDGAWYDRRGNNRNLIAGNDFSDAVAHGIEMTFSFDNRIIGNRLAGNGICGIWAGYSQDTVIEQNAIADNGAMGYGLERGGVNIEHGFGNVIRHNTFSANRCGIHLWWDPDEHLMRTPWARRNHTGDAANVIEHNTFDRDELAIQLRETRNVTRLGANIMHEVGATVVTEGESPVERWTPPAAEPVRPPVDLPGRRRPVGARPHLAGRERIVVTEWGPHDWESALLQLVERGSDRHVYRILDGGGASAPRVVTIDGDARVTHEGATVTVRPTEAGVVTPYTLTVDGGGGALTARDAVVPLRWIVRLFATEGDPREDPRGWRAAADHAVVMERSDLRLRFGHGGPGELDAAPPAAADLPRDRFGTIAETGCRLPPGRWRIRTVSDDGIRVWVDDVLVIDDWTWHPPKEHVHAFTVAEPAEVRIRVEHFELDGHAVLVVELAAAPRAVEQ